MLNPSHDWALVHSHTKRYVFISSGAVGAGVFFFFIVLPRFLRRRRRYTPLSFLQLLQPFGLSLPLSCCTCIIGGGISTPVEPIDAAFPPRRDYLWLFLCPMFV